MWLSSVAPTFSGILGSCDPLDLGTSHTQSYLGAAVTRSCCEKNNNTSTRIENYHNFHFLFTPLSFCISKYRCTCSPLRVFPTHILEILYLCLFALWLFAAQPRPCIPLVSLDAIQRILRFHSLFWLCLRCDLMLGLDGNPWDASFFCVRFRLSLLFLLLISFRGALWECLDFE